MKDFLKNEFNPYRQMNAFIRKLAKANVPFDVIGFKSGNDGYCGTLQILIPSVENAVADFVCHAGSYGHEHGLMEVMVHKSETVKALGWWEEDPVKGYLDADEAFEIAQKIADLEGVNSK